MLLMTSSWTFVNTTVCPVTPAACHPALEEGPPPVERTVWGDLSAAAVPGAGCGACWTSSASWRRARLHSPLPSPSSLSFPQRFVLSQPCCYLTHVLAFSPNKNGNSRRTEHLLVRSRASSPPLGEHLVAQQVLGAPGLPVRAPTL